MCYSQYVSTIRLRQVWERDVMSGNQRLLIQAMPLPIWFPRQDAEVYWPPNISFPRDDHRGGREHARALLGAEDLIGRYLARGQEASR